MRREVFWHHSATEAIAQLAARNAKKATRILIAVREFGSSSRGDLKKLAGSDDSRPRVEDWRVILQFVNDRAYVSEVTDRQDTY